MKSGSQSSNICISWLKYGTLKCLTQEGESTTMAAAGFTLVGGIKYLDVNGEIGSFSLPCLVWMAIVFHYHISYTIERSQEKGHLVLMLNKTKHTISKRWVKLTLCCGVAFQSDRHWLSSSWEEHLILGLVFCPFHLAVPYSICCTDNQSALEILNRFWWQKAGPLPPAEMFRMLMRLVG
jgi:hypothetical protein